MNFYSKKIPIFVIYYRMYECMSKAIDFAEQNISVYDGVVVYVFESACYVKYSHVGAMHLLSVTMFKG